MLGSHHSRSAPLAPPLHAQTRLLLRQSLPRHQRLVSPRPGRDRAPRADADPGPHDNLKGPHDHQVGREGNEAERSEAEVGGAPAASGPRQLGSPSISGNSPPVYVLYSTDLFSPSVTTLRECATRVFRMSSSLSANSRTERFPPFDIPSDARLDPRTGLFNVGGSIRSCNLLVGPKRALRSSPSSLCWSAPVAPPPRLKQMRQRAPACPALLFHMLHET